MKVSIITAVFNNAGTLAQTLDSILQQSGVEVEVIVIDGASTDGSLAILRRYESRLKVVVSEPDNGIYDALNKGLAYATGEVVGFLHADDFLAAPTSLQLIVSALNKNQADGVYGDLQYVRKDQPEQRLRYWRSRQFRPALLAQGWMPAHPTLYLRRTVYEETGDFDTRYRIAADYDFMLRVLTNPAYRFAYIPRVLVNMRAGGVSNRSISNLLAKSREDLRIIRQHKLGGWLTLLAKNISTVPHFFSG